MSIPSYQFASLEGENIAKRRVMTKAKKGFETEEQRAVKSGKIDENIKNIYKAIIANLELQLTTLQVGNAVGTGAVGEYGAELDRIDENMVSKVISVLGRLVRLSSQLKTLIESLRDVSAVSNKPTAFDTQKIVSLIEEVDRERGTDNQAGFGMVVGAIIEAILENNLNPDNINRLEDIYTKNTTASLKTLSDMERNAYQSDLTSITIPIREGRTVNIERRADIASGAEQRNFSRQEYELLLQLREDGLLQDDDFTSV
jgi:hypothetical protein